MICGGVRLSAPPSSTSGANCDASRLTRRATLPWTPSEASKTVTHGIARRSPNERRPGWDWKKLPAGTVTGSVPSPRHWRRNSLRTAPHSVAPDSAYSPVLTLPDRSDAALHILSDPMAEPAAPKNRRRADFSVLPVNSGARTCIVSKGRLPALSFFPEPSSSPSIRQRKAAIARASWVFSRCSLRQFASHRSRLRQEPPAGISRLRTPDLRYPLSRPSQPVQKAI